MSLGNLNQLALPPRQGTEVAGGVSPLPSPVPGHPERCCGQRGSASFHPQRAQPVLWTNIALREPENTEFQANCHKTDRWSDLEAVRALLGKKHTNLPTAGQPRGGRLLTACALLLTGAGLVNRL